ncbi:MAG: cation:proton antiporter [Phycisphaerae bacterium]|nr:cation:proton antiporter [Phycisphaerae bacterium]
MDAQQIMVLFLGLGTLLATALVLGELARRLNQPAVLGEILAGVLLGPTVLGWLAPSFTAFLFPSTGSSAVALNGLTTLAITLFLLVAGIEVDLSTVWRQGRAVFWVGTAGTVVPFALGLVAAWCLPSWLGRGEHADGRIFALFFATALSISALPVIARTLMDLSLYRSDLGMVIVAAAVLNDLVGWVVFAVILSLLGTPTGHGLGVGYTIALTLGFTVLMLTAGRALIHRSLPWIQAHTSWPGGVLGFALAITLLSAAFTEWIGVHVVFGAFLAGVAIGDSPHLREHTRTIISDFVSFIFAPLFFASIGLNLNFVARFDTVLVLLVLVLACVGKIAGCGLGGWLCGMSSRESWALGFGMNARGAMQIVLGLLARQYGVIDERMFVALVVMALATTMMTGPAMQRLLKLKKPRHLAGFMHARMFLNPIPARSREEAIRVLTQAASSLHGLAQNEIEQAVLDRERTMPTGVGSGVAVPHARIEQLAAPLVAAGISRDGIDFNAPDGEPAQFIFLILTPQHDDGAQLEILADIAGTFRDAQMRDKALNVKGYTEWLALMRARTRQTAG